jgi:hypothetical protein
LYNDEEEIEDLHSMWKIEDILCATYERKTIGYGSSEEEGSPFQIQISVEPTTPYATKTSEEEKEIKQQVISGGIIFTRRGSRSRSASSTSSIQVSTLHRGGSSINFTMARQYPMENKTLEKYEGFGKIQEHVDKCMVQWILLPP